MKHRSFILLGSAYILSVPLIALAFGKGPQVSGGGCPAGYQGLTGEWCVKEEFDGTTTTRNWSVDENGQEVSTTTTNQWPGVLGGSAANGTPSNHNVYCHSQGNITVRFKWRGTGTPPQEIRLKVSSYADVQSNSFNVNAPYSPDSWSLDSGIGLPVEDTGGLYGWQRTTPGHVLRKVRIDGNGEGQFQVTQSGNIEQTGVGTFSIRTNVPSLQYEIDNREVTLTLPTLGNPKRKLYSDVPHSQAVSLPQDQYSYYSSSGHDPFWNNRIFNFRAALPDASPIVYPSGSTDFSVWHIGLTQDNRTLFEYLENQITVYERIGYQSLVAPASEGDAYDWTFSLGMQPGWPENLSLSGIYDGSNLLNFTIRSRDYVEPSFYIFYPYTSLFHMAQYPGHAGQTTTVRFKWTWNSDGLVGESVREVHLHRNGEPDGQKSETWWDLKVGDLYLIPPSMTFTPPDTQTQPEDHWVTAGATSCEISDLSSGRIKYSTVAAIISYIAIGVGAFDPSPVEEAIAALLLTSAGIAAESGLEGEDPAVTIQRSHATEGQCDSLKVVPAVSVPGYGSVTFADYRDPQKLAALKVALSNQNMGIYYWKADYRRIFDFYRYVVDSWGFAGYSYQSINDKYTPKGIGSAYYFFTFDQFPGGV